ncbi:MAG: hypothetical protein ACRC5V_09715, partial [Aeromonas sp.]
PVVLRPVADGMKRFAHDGYLKRDDSDQITGSSISSMHVASIWETTPLTAEHTATLAWSGDFDATGLTNPAAAAADSVLILTATNGSDVNAVTTGALTNTLPGDTLTAEGFAYSAQLQGGVKPGDFTATATYTVTYQ